MNKIELDLEEAEEYSFYESGLSADGCLDKLDEYTKKAIKRYGRILLNLSNKKENVQ